MNAENICPFHLKYESDINISNMLYNANTRFLIVGILNAKIEGPIAFCGLM